ncbi:MAG TPA: iron-sulfur cluster assembly accessory protein, partial [Phenylobacterium sp.]|uniref:HesB/IscA family protein n=1 Tax=Phenylobacterium sp. TaxID=1871053 RepID=UPI002D31E114
METTVQTRPRRPRPKVVTLTDAAADRVREIMAKAEKPYAGLRVGVKNGGCAGQEYVLGYAETADPLDEVVEDKGVRILI